MSTRAQAAGGEVLAFKVSPAVLRHVIESEAGLLEKAMLELVSNGVDAKAEKIEVEIEPPATLRVRDDGRALPTREDTLRHFAIFGFDHDSDAERALERQLGRFGLGRGQIFAFGHTVWRTHGHEMRVDIRANTKGFALEVIEGPPVKGCEITVSLYQDLWRNDKAHLERTLARQLRYVGSDIRIGGHR